MIDLVRVLKCDRQLVGLENLLQVMGVSRQVLCVKVADADQRPVGAIWIKSGVVIEAKAGSLTGVEAFQSVVTDPAGVAYSVFRAPQSPAKYPAPLGSLTKMLLEIAMPAERDLASEPAEPEPVPAPSAESVTVTSAPVEPARGPVAVPTPAASIDGVRAPTARPEPAPRPAGPVAIPAIGPRRQEGCPVVALVSPKGGVGKTTVALNLAVAFAEEGVSVLLIDADPQGGVAASLGGDETGARKGVFDVLLGKEHLRDVVIQTKIPSLSILPSGGLSSQEAARNILLLTSPEPWRKIVDSLSDTRQLVLIDTPAGLYGITHGVLGACTHVVTVLESEPLALRVLPHLISSLGEAGAPGGTGPVLAGIILNCVQFRVGASLGVVQDAWARFPTGLILETTVPRDAVFLEASEKGVPVAFLDRKRRPAVSAVFRHLSSDLAERIGLADTEPAGEAVRLI